MKKIISAALLIAAAVCAVVFILNYFAPDASEEN